MSLWILASLAAAVFQTVRFMLQKTLADTSLSAAGATYARFLYSAPIAVTGMALYLGLGDVAFPQIGGAFLIFCVIGGAAQVMATVCIVKVFKARNFAVGMTFAKVEVIMTVLVGLIVLGEGVSPLGFIWIIVGVIGVILLSVDPTSVGMSWSGLINRAAGLGIASGLFFSVSGVCYRAASLTVMSDDPVIRAGLTLAVVTSLQTIGMSVWLRARETGEISRVVRAWRRAGLIGLTSIAGSFGWFFAFTLQNVAYVKAVGQVELIFGLAASVFFFREVVRRRELWGIAVLSASIFGVILTI